MTGHPSAPSTWSIFGPLADPPVRLAFALRMQADWLRPLLTGDLAHLLTPLSSVDAVATRLGGARPEAPDPSALSGQQACQLLDLIHESICAHGGRVAEVLPGVLDAHRALASHAR